MGYTHYWSFNRIPKGQTVQVERAYQRAVRKCSQVIQAYSKEHGGLSGFSAHAPLGIYSGVNVNGSERAGQCEDFILRERFKLNEFGNFCKTNRHPYDIVVVACLIILKSELKDLIIVNSDGFYEDWTAGLALIRSTISCSRGYNIPNSIQPRNNGVAK